MITRIETRDRTMYNILIINQFCCHIQSSFAFLNFNKKKKKKKKRRKTSKIFTGVNSIARNRSKQNITNVGIQGNWNVSLSDRSSGKSREK